MLTKLSLEKLTRKRSRKSAPRGLKSLSPWPVGEKRKRCSGSRALFHPQCRAYIRPRQETKAGEQPWLVTDLQPTAVWLQRPARWPSILKSLSRTSHRVLLLKIADLFLLPLQSGHTEFSLLPDPVTAAGAGCRTHCPEHVPGVRNSQSTPARVRTAAWPCEAPNQGREWTAPNATHNASTHKRLQNLTLMRTTFPAANSGRLREAHTLTRTENP